MPARLGQVFYRYARTGTIDPDTDDDVPPIKVESVRLIKDVVLASDAVGAAPYALIRDEVERGSLACLDVRLAWLHTGYGSVYLKERTLSPAAQAFIAEIKTLEAEIDRDGPPADPKAPSAKRKRQQRPRGSASADAAQLDQPLLVEERLAPARHRHLLEQSGLRERIVVDELLGLGAAVGVDDQHPAVAAGTVVVDQCAGCQQQVLMLGEVFEMRRTRLGADVRATGLVLGLDHVGHGSFSWLNSSLVS